MPRLPRIDPDIRLKAVTFFDRRAVIDAIGAGAAKALTRVGAYVRAVARNSIRTQRRLTKRQLYTHLTPAQLEKYRRLQRKSHARGEGNPLRPHKPGNAPPGSPPFNKTGLLKRHIYFGYDRVRQSCVIGPIHIGTARTAHLLEHGGIGHLYAPWARGIIRMHYRGNPFMRPALEKTIPVIPSMFQNVAVPTGRGQLQKTA